MRLFAGRMNRSTFLLVVMVAGLFSVVISRPDVKGWLDDHAGIALLIVCLGAIPLLVWLIAAAVRRLHDITLPGLWAVLLVVPGMQLFLLLMPGTKGKNRYGPQPTQTLDLGSLLSDSNQK